LRNLRRDIEMNGMLWYFLMENGGVGDG